VDKEEKRLFVKMMQGELKYHVTKRVKQNNKKRRRTAWIWKRKTIRVCIPLV